MTARTKDWNQILQESHDNYATKITTSGSLIYIAIAAMGTLQSAAKWQVKKIDTSSPTDTVITWANGSDAFSNVATNLAALTYS